MSYTNYLGFLVKPPAHLVFCLLKILKLHFPNHMYTTHPPDLHEWVLLLYLQRRRLRQPPQFLHGNVCVQYLARYNFNFAPNEAVAEMSGLDHLKNHRQRYWQSTRLSQLTARVAKTRTQRWLVSTSQHRAGGLHHHRGERGFVSGKGEEFWEKHLSFFLLFGWELIGSFSVFLLRSAWFHTCLILFIHQRNYNQIPLKCLYLSLFGIDIMPPLLWSLTRQRLKFHLNLLTRSWVNSTKPTVDHPVEQDRSS